MLLFGLVTLQDQSISVCKEEDKSPLVSLEFKVLSQCPSLIIVCSLVVVWVGCFTGPVHKSFYGVGQKSFYPMRFYHVQKLQYLVTDVVVVVVVCQKKHLSHQQWLVTYCCSAGAQHANVSLKN